MYTSKASNMCALSLSFRKKNNINKSSKII